ncbi:MAG: Fur family transcriptional regulator [Thermodesulfobacteriota bacterium]
MQKYRVSGLKLTPQRLAILDYLDGNKTHPSAEEVYKAVSKKFPTMSLATVYNTLMVLKQRGLIRELTMDPAKMRYDPQPAAHHHLICVDCRKIVDIHTRFRIHLPEMEREGFEIVGNHIEFYGRCSKCKNKKHETTELPS